MCERDGSQMYARYIWGNRLNLAPFYPWRFIEFILHSMFDVVIVNHRMLFLLLMSMLLLSWFLCRRRMKNKLMHAGWVCVCRRTRKRIISPSNGIKWQPGPNQQHHHQQLKRQKTEKKRKIEKKKKKEKSKLRRNTFCFIHIIIPVKLENFEVTEKRN